MQYVIPSVQYQTITSKKRKYNPKSATTTLICDDKPCNLVEPNAVCNMNVNSCKKKCNVEDLVICTDFNVDDDDVQISEKLKKYEMIKAIKIKRNAPQLIKSVLNYKHNLLLIQSKLITMQEQKNLQNKYDFTKPITFRLLQKNCGLEEYTNILNSWLKLIMLHHLKHHVYARLKNGKYGVSIVATKDIPPYTRVFENTAGPCTMYYPVTIHDSAFDNITKPTPNTQSSKLKSPELKAIQQLLNDFYLSLLPEKKNFKLTAEYPIPVLGPNMIDMSFFLNHSHINNNIKIEINNKNTKHCDMSSYVSSKKIKEGETLYINYAEFALDSNSDKTNIINVEKLKNLVSRMKFLAELEPFNKFFDKDTGDLLPGIIDDNIKNKDIWFPPQPKENIIAAILGTILAKQN